MSGLLVALPMLAAMPAHGQVVTRFTYDAGDHVTSITDPRGLTTTYTYDGLGQKWQQVSPDTGTTTYSYDAAGRLASLTRNQASPAYYGYDAIGRLTAINVGDAWQLFAYDTCSGGVGRLCSVTDANSKTTYTYSPEGWITGRSFAVGGMSYALGYGYNTLGQVTTVAYPDGNQALYTYAHGVVSSVQAKINGVVSNVATNIAYQPGDAAMAQWTSGNGLTNTLAYDADGRLFNIYVPGIQSLGFSYDAANRIVGIRNDADAAMNQTFGYDAMSRLASVRSGADNEDFTYDANGNRTSHTLNGAAVAVSVRDVNNQVTQLSGASNTRYGYDWRGNLTTVNDAPTFSYDVFNRMNAAGSATYVVNPEGQRLRKTVNGVSSYFAPDAAGPLLAENPGGGWSDYVWLNGRLIARMNAGKVLAIHNDQVGRPEAMTDANRNVVWRARNFAFDRTVVQDHAVPLNLGFPGQIHDAESGLWYNGARYYSAAIGGYIQPDPIGLAGGSASTYIYADDNPLSNIDPLGLEYAESWAAGGAIAGGTIVAGGSVVVDAFTGGLNILATGPEIAAGSAIGGGIGYLAGSALDWATSNGVYSKGGPQNVRDTGLIGVSDAEIEEKLKDPSTSPAEKLRLQKEQKARGTRNKKKRSGC